MSPSPTSPARPTTSLAAVTDLLGLHPADPGSPDVPGTTRLGVVAGRSGPRFLVPVGHPDAAPQACLAYLGLRDARTRATRGAVGLALRFGGQRFVAGQELAADTGPGSLLALLDDLLADPDEEPGLAVGVGLGHLDEVWKPTLQVFRPDGTPAAFVKVGLGPVADRLVATEAETLAAWARHPDPRLVVPELIAHTTWNDIRIAVVAPLPLDVHRLPTTGPSAWAVRTLDGPVLQGQLAEAPWWTGRVEACASQSRPTELLERVALRHADLEASWARWHGDWVPWNLARCHRGLVAWDWEYSEPGAPVGLDEVHGAYQQAHVVEARPIAESLAVARATAARLAAHAGSPATVQDLRDQAGTDAPPLVVGPAGWLADAHVAMLVTRSAELERLAGHPPADQLELYAAADAALDATGTNRP